MTFPTSILGLRQPIQDSSGVQAAESYTIALASSYQYVLGSAASPPFPAGWQVVPKGAFPLTAPAQMATFATDTTAGGGLVAASAYSWAVSNVTAYGETPPGTISAAFTVGASGTGVLATLPAVTVSTANPVIRRRLWRTKAGGTQLYYVADLPDLAVATYLDRVPDAALTLVNPTGNTSGLSSPVSVTIAGAGATEKAPGSTLVGGDFIVDYTTGLSGGTVTFASADVGKLAVITYTASLDISAPFLGTLVTALQDMYNNGLTHGVRQILAVPAVDVSSITGRTTQAFPSSHSVSITTAAGGKIRFNYGLGFTMTASVAGQVSFLVALYIDGVFVADGSVYGANVATATQQTWGTMAGSVTSNVLSAGPHTAQLFVALLTDSTTLNATFLGTTQWGAVEEIA